ncbi:MAG: SIR2 family protein [Beijerinckiaceae bacterium]|nr:SIR2 family protein [Beijerinckiaceae bacterium]
MSDDQAEVDDLARAIKERRVILFAGAGLSMSVGLPSWSELISHLAGELELSQDILSSPGCTYQTLAEFYRIRNGSIGPLRSWMDRNWRLSEDKVRESRLHQLVISLDFPIIYTTNYDRNVETAFQASGRDYVKVANARDIANTREGITQVVKFHGDFDDDESLVITETDYFNRLAFDSPLDIKFRSDALGKTVLFVGYSMSDMNIRLLMHRLWRTWRLSGCEKDRPRSFVFMANANPVQEAILSEWGLTVIRNEAGDPETGLADFLERIRLRVEQRDGEERSGEPQAARR